MMKEKKSSFKGKVVSSAERQRESRKGGVLNVPKGVKMLKFPEKARSFEVDFLPYVVTSEKHPERDDTNGIAIPGSIWYRSPYKVHQHVGSEDESVICPRSVGKRCPICEYQLKRIKEGADKEEFKVLYPKERSLYVVIPIGHKDYDEVPHVWDMSDFLFQETLVEELREDAENEDFFTLDNGKTVALRLKWKEIGNNSFPEVVSVSFSEREPYEEAVMDDVPDLDAMLKILPYEELFNKFHYGGEAVETEAETEAEPEDNTSTRSRKYRAAEKEEEPEEEKPARTRRRTEEKEEEPKPRRTPVKEEKEEEPPARSRTRSRTAPAKEEEEEVEEKCPHGHRFGIDTDEFKECKKCKIWDACIDENDKKK